jgi:hypothetical protein
MAQRFDALFTRARVGIACGALALAYAVFSIHGFSLAHWHFLDESPATELLLGTSQAVRGDDWSLWLPFAFAQIEHDPPFALVNRNVALGQNMALVTSAPIADPLIVYRPPVWGFFVGADVGMGWCWGLFAFGFLAAFHLLFMEISDGRGLLSFCAAVALLFAPFFQFWSLNASFLASTVALAVVLTHRLAFATRPREAWLCGLGLGLCGGAFALTLYPPYQVVMGWFGAFVCAGLILRSRKRGRALRWDRHHAAAWLVALLVAGFAVLRLFEIAHEAIAAMRSTLYPGSRVATGGSTELWRIFSNNVYPHVFVRASRATGGNICEAASFILFFPLILGLLLLRKPGRRALAGDPLVIALLAFLAVLLAWNLVSWPEGLARITGLALAPEHRTAIGFGVADMALLVAWLSAPAAEPALRASTRARAAFALALLLPLGLLAFELARRDPQFLGTGALLQTGLLVCAQLAIGIGLALRRQAALLAFACVNVAATVWFNPVAHAGSDQVRNNPVSREVRGLTAERGGNSSWIVFDDLVVGQLPPMLGVRSLASVQFHPQAAFWRLLDPERRMASAYDRFAHVAFRMRNHPAPLAISSPSPDVCIVDAHPDDPRLLALPFDLALQAGAPSQALLRSRNYRRISSVGRYHFFERVRN